MAKERTKKIIIESGKYVVCHTNSNEIIATAGLESDVAFTVYAPDFGKAAMARNIDAKQIEELFEKLTDGKLDSAKEGSIKIRLTGGDQSDKARNAVDSLMKTLSTLDNSKNVINIISSDILDKKKYDSVQFYPSLNSLEPYVVTHSMSR